MPDSVVYKVSRGLTGVKHEAIRKLHRFSTSCTQLAGNDNFASLSTRLHNEPEDTITCTTQNRRMKTVPSIMNELNIPTHGKTTEKLVSQTFTLSNGRKSTVLDLLGIQFKGIFRKFETLLHECSEFADTTTLLSQNFLGVRCTDNDLVWSAESHINRGIHVISLTSVRA